MQLLVLAHRWIGVGACLLFLMWFASGMVMVAVPFPRLSTPERMAGLPAIDWSKVAIGPAEAQRIAGTETPARAVTIEMMGDIPVWRITPSDGSRLTAAATNGRVSPPGGRPVTLSATTGQLLTTSDATQAAVTAGTFARVSVARIEQITSDQWSVEPRYDAHRPLYRARLAGTAKRDLYISSVTGEVLLDVNATERFWNWLGSVPHWLYFKPLAERGDVWRQAMLWITGPCILVAITGLWLGLWRARWGKRRYRNNRITPYSGWMLWHHIAGLAGGITLTLWIFSGWLSIDPGHFFSSPGIDAPTRDTYIGAGALPSVDIMRLAEAAGDDAKRLEFFWAVGHPWVWVNSEQRSAKLDATRLLPADLEQTVLLNAAGDLMPGSSIASVERLTRPDFYWYDLLGLPQLPVLRVEFTDRAATWLHIDPDTGRVLGMVDRRGRVFRWGYSLFHKWDLNALMLNRPAWDLFMWAFASIGLVTSASAIWIALRRLGSVSKI